MAIITRRSESGDRLEQALAVLARRSPARLALAGLPVPDAAVLIRLSRLPPPAVATLRLAAVVGPEADVEVLVDAADTDEDGVIAGLLAEPAPGCVRFVHALVRDTVYADLTQLRLTTRQRAAEAATPGAPDLLALALTAGTMVVNYEREPGPRRPSSGSPGNSGAGWTPAGAWRRSTG